ncbi:MAG: DUF4465 domain-containing protein [Phycisphaerae bacterium]|nr:DUF4465 domain-containing protein [Phycisphaerae bacterium]
MRMSFVTTMMFVLTLSMGLAALADPPDFDDLPLASESYWNGSDGSGGFSSGSAFFNNSFTDWGGGVISWDGFAYSNLTQEETPPTAMPGQYTAITGSGQTPANYAVGYVGWAGLPTMSLAQPMQLDRAYFTNNRSAYYSMLNGDGFAKQFGGPSGDDPDWFLLTIEGFDQQQNSTGTVDFYLADYRGDNNLDYIVNDWARVDLSGLGVVQEVTFDLSSSDNIGDWMNTPAYFAMDTVLPRIDVEIDIKPRNNRQMVNLNSEGVLRLAVLGGEDFDVHEIDLLSLKLADAEPRAMGNSGKIGLFKDVNNDSQTDLVLHFNMGDLNVAAEATELILEGFLNDGTLLTGGDSATIICPGNVNGDGQLGGALLEITAIPEPSVCLLLSLGGLALMKRRRAKSEECASIRALRSLNVMIQQRTSERHENDYSS